MKSEQSASGTVSVCDKISREDTVEKSFFREPLATLLRRCVSIVNERDHEIDIRDHCPLDNVIQIKC